MKTIIDIIKIKNNDPQVTTLNYNNHFIMGDWETKILANALIKNSFLTNLDLGSNKISDKGAQALVSVLIQNSSLARLNLSYNLITNEGAKELRNAMIQNSSLVELSLNHNNISDEGVKALAYALIKNSSLAKLSLNHNNITDEGVKALAYALIKNSSLTELNLNHNNITDEGVTALSHALIKNSSLTELSLSGNNITDEGVKALSHALIQNSSLAKLNLSHNNITDEGVKALAYALEKNSFLTEIDLGKNKFTNDGIRILAKTLKENYVLTTIDLTGDFLDFMEGILDDMEKLTERIEEDLYLLDLAISSKKDNKSKTSKVLEASKKLETIKEAEIIKEVEISNESEISKEPEAISSYLKTNILNRNKKLHRAISDSITKGNLSLLNKVITAYPILLKAPVNEGQIPLHLALKAKNQHIINYLLTQMKQHQIPVSKSLEPLLLSTNLPLLSLSQDSSLTTTQFEETAKQSINSSQAKVTPLKTKAEEIEASNSFIHSSSKKEKALATLQTKKEKTSSLSDSSQASEKSPPQATMTSLKKDTLVSLNEQSTQPLAKNQPLEAKYNKERSLLHEAARTGNIVTMIELLEQGAEIEAKNKDGCTPLHEAARAGKITAIIKLLERGATIEAKNNKGCTPLHRAARAGKIKTVVELLKRGAEIGARDRNGHSPLFYAEAKGHKDVIALLKNWNNKDTSPQATQLQIALPISKEKVTEDTASLDQTSSLQRSAESKKSITLPTSQSESLKVKEGITPETPSSQAPENSLPQEEINSLKKSALLSLEEQHTQLLAAIETLQALTSPRSPTYPGKIVSLTPEQEEALHKVAYKQAQLKELEQLKTTPNLGEFYQTLVINIEALFLAIKTAQTNLMKVQLQGTSGKAAQVTQVVGGFLEAIPVIGNTAKSVANVATKVLTKFDEYLIAQKLKQLHQLGTQKQYQAFILEFAKFLTLRYEDQLARLLPAPTEATQEHPGKALANYVVMTFFDHLMSYPVTITSFLTSSRPVILTFEQVKAEYLEKLAPRLQTTLTELGLELLTFLSKDTVTLKSGKKLSLQAILTKPGIRIGKTEFFDHDLGKLTDAAQYGYRLGTKQEALQYKLIKSANKAPHLSAAELNASSPISDPSTIEPTPRTSPVVVPVVTALQNVSSQQAPSQAMDLEQVLQRLEALEKSNQEKEKEIKLLKQKLEPSPNSWVGRVHEVSVSNQLLIQKELLQSDSLFEVASPQMQAQRIEVLEQRMSYTEQVVSNLSESVDTTAKIAMGIRTTSMVQKTTVASSQKGTSPSK